jgi:hypothetical protein
MLFLPNDPVRQARSWNEHAAILRAIIEGDERAAATLAAEHVTRAGADFLFGLDVFEEGSVLPAGPKRSTKLRSGQSRMSSTTHELSSRGEVPRAGNAAMSGRRFKRVRHEAKS